MKDRISEVVYIVDIGASGGIDPKWKKLEAPIKGVLFEPDPREYKNLESSSDNNLIVLNSALSDKSERLIFHLCAKQMVSSVYEPNFDFLELFPDSSRFKVVKKIEVNADTLSHQLEINNIKNVDFIKIDTQGYELSILKGGGRYIDNSVGLEIEVEFEEMYKGQPLFGDIDSFMTSKGFVLFDLKRYFWKRKNSKSTGNQKGQLIFGDALYFKTPEEILKATNVTEKKVIRSISVYLTYGYIDLSQVLLNQANSMGLLSEETNQLLGNLIKKSQKGVFFDFLKNERVSNLLRRIGDFFDKGHAYSGTDKVLGGG